MLNFHPASPIHCPEISEPVDIVYTWVNGTDPDFLQQVQEFKAKEGKPKDGELVSRRFHGKTKYQVTYLSLRSWSKIMILKLHSDMDQLKYSLRSVELYIPWARHVYIVTNGQGTDCEIHIPISTQKCQRLYLTFSINILNRYVIKACYVIEKSTIMVKYNKR